MSQPPEKQPADSHREQFANDVQKKAHRKAQAKEHEDKGSMWFGLGTFGMVGWSVVIPTLLGVLLGAWLDAVIPMSFSWRLTLMFAGLIMGCANAWYWVSKERRHIESERERRRNE